MRHLPRPLAAALLTASPALAAPKVVASVVPVHGIVSAVMGDIGQPELLLKGRMSEHRASLHPLPDRHAWEGRPGLHRRPWAGGEAGADQRL